ncbi:hypothetical protein [Thermoflexibacter ruber]|uniref:NigD-like protein n=1 Tax=Thermoflexibacter ruber TaxID=1003 RepID=A0A1I2D2S3_9BACT|nr:hypothetical protein [Thermoflexibacter ruber]SFE74794.1 hypothetical protein SAMN04488541_100637 [Thermoflexibacter ruber]
MKNLLMKNLLALVVFLLLFSCTKQEEFSIVPVPESGIKFYTQGKGNKVVIHYDQEIYDGDWIQIDDLPKLYHRLDTSYSYEPNTTSVIRINYPMFDSDVKDLWISRSYIRRITFQEVWRWFYAYTSLGLPAYSLYLHLVNYRKIAQPFNLPSKTDSPRYVVSFPTFTPKEWTENEFKLFWHGNNFDRLQTMVIERTDGRPIRIQTSEGYGAKMEYK